MHSPKSLFFFLFIILLLNCKNNDKEEFICSYTFLENINSSTKNNHNNGISFNLNAVIKSNLNKLFKANLEGKGTFNTEYLNSIEEISFNSQTYSGEFLEKHNAIISILCDVEKELSLNQNDTIYSKKLRREKTEKRTKYFDFILGNIQQVKTPIQKKDTIIKIEDKKSINIRKTPEINNEVYSFFLYLDSKEINALVQLDDNPALTLSGNNTTIREIQIPKLGNQYHIKIISDSRMCENQIIISSNHQKVFSQCN